MFRVLIVEDNPVAVEDLKRLLRRHREFTLIGATDSIKDAKVNISAEQPDLLLLDIQLKDGTAFDLLESLDKITFKIIFTTGFDEFAIRAIKFGALDYLLKPIDKGEFDAALLRAKEAKLSEQHLRQSFDIANGYFHSTAGGWNRIALRSQYTLQVVAFDEILYLESSESYTHFHLTEGRTVVVSRSVIEYEQLLPRQQFLRCHQSYLVNGYYIDHYHNDGHVALKGGQQIPVSRRKKERVISFLSGNQPEV